MSYVIEQGYVLQCEPAPPGDPQAGSRSIDLPFTDLSKLRRTAVQQALRISQGHKGNAARMLGIHPNTMTRLLGQLDGEKPK